MKNTIKTILIEMIDTLEAMNNEQEVLKDVYKKAVKERVKDKGQDWVDFYVDLVEKLGEINIGNITSNDIVLSFYEQNLSNLQQLEKHSLKLYKLYLESNTDSKIEYYENLKKEKLLKQAELQNKEFINVSEFETLYNYSVSSQKNFRSRLNNPLPFVQKEFNKKILYKKSEVEDWLANKK